MPENVKARTRTNSRRVTTPGPDTSGTEAVVPEAVVPESGVGTDAQAPDAQAPDAQAPDAPTRDAAETTPAAGPDTTPEDAARATAGVTADGAVGWADAVPSLALRHGPTPTAAETRFAPVVWTMLHQQTGPGSTAGRTVLQMAAEAELAGHTDLDPTTLTRVLARYERAGVVRSVTDGRLARWSVLNPADVIAHAQESAQAGASPARTRRTGVTSRVGGGVVTPTGGLRGLVADHLAQHPDQNFSPTQIANALGRSSGAVANALERLVEHGAAVQTCTTPRRYQHHTDPAHDGTQDSTGPDEVQGDTDLDRKAS